MNFNEKVQLEESGDGKWDIYVYFRQSWSSLSEHEKFIWFRNQILCERLQKNRSPIAENSSDKIIF